MTNLKQTKTLYFFLLLIIVGLSSCGAHPDLEKVDKKLSSIVGGGPVTDKDQYKNVVAISFEGHTLCTGTLISPRHILSAGHCVLPIELPGSFPDFLDKVRVHTGLGIEGRKFKGGHQIVSYSTHPLYKKNNQFRGNFDLGIFELAKPLDGVTPVELANESTEYNTLAPKQMAKLVGYGFRENVVGGFMRPTSTKVGKKYQLELPIVERNSTEVILSAADKSACSGDSGGPLFSTNNKGQLIQVGVASRIMGACGGARTKTFYSRLAHARCWIDSEITNSPSNDSLCQSSFGTVHTQEVLESILAQRDLKPSEVKKIDLSGRLLTDISALKDFTNLEELDLSDNLIKSAEVLKKLPQLKKVNLAQNYLQEDFFLKNGSQVYLGRYKQESTAHKTMFYRSCTQEREATRDEQLIVEEIKDSTGTQECLEAHERIKEESMFSLENKNIKSFEMLKDYPMFSMLALGGNKIQDLSFMSRMEHLEAVYLENNKIQDISVLAKLPVLNFVSLSNNDISDLKPLEAPRDDHVMIRLDGNPAKASDCATLTKVMCL